MKIAILTPVYNDWESFKKLIVLINDMFIQKGYKEVNIIAVNDGSTNQLNNIPNSINQIKITVLNTTINLGHQRAIALGLSYISDTNLIFDYIIVMDSDGEDKPDDILKLINLATENQNEKIVFAKRTKRSEGIFFKLFYKLYKLVFVILTGQKINFGNFSCIPKLMLSKVISNPEIWNHYSGSIIKSKLPYTLVPTNRGRRYFGKSRMNFNNLILHGLSSISIYINIVTIKLLLFVVFLSCIALSGIFIIFYLKLFTDYTISGWASSLSMTIFNTLIITFLFTFLIVLLQLNNRNVIQISPKDFYKNYIESINKL